MDNFQSRKKGNRESVLAEENNNNNFKRQVKPKGLRGSNSTSDYRFAMQRFLQKGYGAKSPSWF